MKDFMISVFWENWKQKLSCTCQTVMPGSNFHFPFWIDFKIWYHSQNCSEKFNFYLPNLPPLLLILPPNQMACNILTLNSALQNEKLVSTNLFTVRNILWKYFKYFAFRRKRIIRGMAHCCTVIYWGVMLRARVSQCDHRRTRVVMGKDRNVSRMMRTGNNKFSRAYS